ncbi:MAG: EAL domain-containing protein [Pseudomonadota bacterium]
MTFRVTNRTDAEKLALHPDEENSGSKFELTDHLTGIANRRRMFQKVEKQLEQLREDPVPFAICLINLDGFKPLNDYFGRRAGDDILCQVAQRLKTALPEGALAARISGDCFAAYLPKIYTDRAAEEMGQLLIDIMSAPFDLGEHSARLTATVGFSFFMNADDTADNLFHRADTAVYHAKKAGRGLCQVFSASMAREQARQLEIEQALRIAIARETIEPYFQPIVDLPTGRTLGFEALARWTDSSLGFVSPAEFIPLAEERGLIVPLTRALLSKAAKDACSWPDDVFLSFNLSPAQLIDPSTVNTVISIISKAGFPADRLELEITETSMMANPEVAAQIIREMRSVGIRISLDDFGTGQSSLGRLREFQFDKLKIDRAFVSTMLDDGPTGHIVKAILQMCEGLQMKVVAEGIEEEAQAKVLANQGCGAGQGWLYGKAEKAEDALKFVNGTNQPFSLAG